MDKSKRLINAAVVGILAAGTFIGTAHAVPNTPTEWEKCTGVSKAGKNDCGALDGKHNCAGYATADDAVTEWVYVPKGTCDKLTGGQVAAVKPAK